MCLWVLAPTSTCSTLYCCYWQENEFDRGWSEAWETKLLASVSHSGFPALTNSTTGLGIEWDPAHAEKRTADRPQKSLWRWTWSSLEQASLHHLTGGKCASALITWLRSNHVTSFLPSKPILPAYLRKHQSEDNAEILTLAQYEKPGVLLLRVLGACSSIGVVFSCQLLCHLVSQHRSTFLFDKPSG